jgi:hypothetical protein
VRLAQSRFLGLGNNHSSIMQYPFSGPRLPSIQSLQSVIEGCSECDYTAEWRKQGFGCRSWDRVELVQMHAEPVGTSAYLY